MRLILKNKFRNTKMHTLYRSLKMLVYRNYFGLKFVSKTFYMAGVSNISKDFKAGDYSFLAEGCKIGPKVSIGNYTMLGPKVAILVGDHKFDVPGVPIYFSGRPPSNETIIGSDVWIGYGVTIIGGVKIGNGSIIAAGSVVTKNIPQYEIHAGIPAKKVKNRFNHENDIHIE